MEYTRHCIVSMATVLWIQGNNGLFLPSRTYNQRNDPMHSPLGPSLFHKERTSFLRTGILEPHGLAAYKSLEEIEDEECFGLPEVILEYNRWTILTYYNETEDLYIKAVEDRIGINPIDIDDVRRFGCTLAGTRSISDFIKITTGDEADQGKIDAYNFWAPRFNSRGGVEGLTKAIEIKNYIHNFIYEHDEEKDEADVSGVLHSIGEDGVKDMISHLVDQYGPNFLDCVSIIDITISNSTLEVTDIDDFAAYLMDENTEDKGVTGLSKEDADRLLSFLWQCVMRTEDDRVQDRVHLSLYTALHSAGLLKLTHT